MAFRRYDQPYLFLNVPDLEGYPPKLTDNLHPDYNAAVIKAGVKAIEESGIVPQSLPARRGFLEEWAKSVSAQSEGQPRADPPPSFEVRLILPGSLNDYPPYIQHPNDLDLNARLILNEFKAEAAADAKAGVLADFREETIDANAEDMEEGTVVDHSSSAPAINPFKRLIGKVPSEEITSAVEAGDMGVNRVKKILEQADRPFRPVSVTKTSPVPHSGDLIVKMENVTILVEVTTSATFKRGHQEKLMRDIHEYNADAAIYIYTKDVKRPAFSELTAGGGQPVILLTNAFVNDVMIMASLERLVGRVTAARAVMAETISSELTEMRDKIRRLQSKADGQLKNAKEHLQYLNLLINSACKLYDSCNDTFKEHGLDTVHLNPKKKAKVAERLDS